MIEVSSNSYQQSIHNPVMEVVKVDGAAAGETNSELKLLNDLKLGKKVSIKIIYELYWDKLFRSSYSVLEDEEICQDIVQEIFIDLWERRKTSNIENLKAFLYQAVRNKVAKHIRHIKLKEKHHLSIKRLFGTDMQADKVYEFKELNQNIEVSLNQLPDRCHEVFHLSRYECKSNSEIAESLNISKRTVETHISKAIKHLRTALTGYLLILFSCFFQ